MPEWMTTSDAVSMLEAPRRESPSLIDTSRAPALFALVLVPVGLVIVGIAGLMHSAWKFFALPWP